MKTFATTLALVSAVLCPAGLAQVTSPAPSSTTGPPETTRGRSAGPSLAPGARPPAWLGVTYSEPEPRPGDDDTAPPKGALVTGVVKDGPADRAGLRGGDVIVRVGDTPVTVASELPLAVTRQTVDGWVEIEVDRRGRAQTLSVRTGLRPDDAGAREMRAGAIGVTPVDVPEQLKTWWGGDADHGVLVGEVLAGGPAERGGLQPGDLILEFDARPVPNSAALRERVQRGGVGNRVRVLVSRQGTRFELDIDIEDAPTGRNRRT